MMELGIRAPLGLSVPEAHSRTYDVIHRRSDKLGLTVTEKHMGNVLADGIVPPALHQDRCIDEMVRGSGKPRIAEFRACKIAEVAVLQRPVQIGTVHREIG